MNPPQQAAGSDFSGRLLHWFERFGRHGLPWQQDRTPYRVWVSEIMLQQTQVSTVIPYFERFMARFPSVSTLAAASPDEVLALWAGLGYYARGRNLHRAAQHIVAEHGAELPTSLEALMALPGIGRSTAGAILSQALDQAHAILDGNVRRVIARHQAIQGWPGAPAVQNRLWQQAEAWLPERRAADYTQAIMDLGSLVCTRRNPRCDSCPVSSDCRALAQGLTDQLPAPKPRRARPVRRHPIALIEDAKGRVLLERRPPAGLWGGLWCLPMGQADESPRALADRLGTQPSARSELSPVRHALTHFELHLLPVHARASAPDDVVREQAQLRWIEVDDEQSWPGLPAPVRALLQQMRQHALHSSS